MLIILMRFRPQGISGTSLKRTYVSLEPIRKFFVKEEK